MNNKKIFDQIINSKEPISIEKYINLCLYSKGGYYIQNQAVGKKGDFTTAPEISQLFGELIGLYIYSFWEKNLFKEFNLVELGPGRGTLLIDILNITKSFKQFNKLTKIFLIEKNKLLKKNQIENFNKFNINPSDIEWLTDFRIKNNKPTIIFANEFFDCLPIKQFHRKNGKFFEKKIIYNKKEKRLMNFDDLVVNKKILSNINNFEMLDVLEISSARDIYLNKIFNHISNNNGMIIIIDYGYFNRPNHFTLQSLYNNKRSHIYDNIGMQDITSLIDFKRIINLAKAKNLNIDVFSSQRDFLIKLGIYERFQKIKKNASTLEERYLKKGLERLIDATSMGSLFKVLIVSK